MSSTLPPPTSPCPPAAQLAEIIHHATAVDPRPRIVFVSLEPNEKVAFGFWDIPLNAPHPADPLVGFRAPRTWHALGLITTAQMRRLDHPAEPATPVTSTVLLQRDGAVVSILDGPDRPAEVITDAPAGWVPDAMHRALGLPTPPPEQSTAALIELTWLDRIATGLLGRPSRARGWRWLADRHPLRGDGPPPPPEQLAAATAAAAVEITWADLQARAGDAPLPAATLGPPGGQILPAAEWFDEGSICRWTLRELPPAEGLLPDLLSVLPPALGQSLVAALVEIDAVGG